tara:strand:- start:1502 stop:2002 length:501 start_codon:yes stop_codon:yes gene_type:complete
MAGYIGIQPVPQATQTRDSFTATAGQTSFTTGGYTPEFLDVYLNGVFLTNGTDYTASNGLDVILTVAAALSDVLEVVAYTTFESGDHYTKAVSDSRYIAQGTPTGGGMFKGENGTVGTQPGDIFRVNEQILNTNTTIDSDENASATGPLEIASSVTLTVNGNLTVI